MCLSCLKFTKFTFTVCQDLTKGFSQTWSKGEEEGEEEEVEEDNVDEEEVEEADNETSVETEGPSSSLDDSTEKPTEETQSPVSLLFITYLFILPVDTNM